MTTTHEEAYAHVQALVPRGESNDHAAWLVDYINAQRVAHSHVERLRKALAQIANHPTGWPPAEEENASMRGIASAALGATP